MAVTTESHRYKMNALAQLYQRFVTSDSKIAQVATAKTLGKEKESSNDKFAVKTTGYCTV